MNYPQDLFVNWNGLIKNRLGPYKLVLKYKDIYRAINSWSSNKKNAFDYGQSQYYFAYIFMDQKLLNSGKVTGDWMAKIYLTTAAGDIEVFEKDFKRKD